MNTYTYTYACAYTNPTRPLADRWYRGGCFFPSLFPQPLNQSTNQPINQPTYQPTPCIQPLPPNLHREGFTPPYNPFPAAWTGPVCGRRRSRFWSLGGFGPDLFLVPFLIHFLVHFWAPFGHPSSAPDPLRRGSKFDPFLEPLWYDERKS